MHVWPEEQSAVVWQSAWAATLPAHWPPPRDPVQNVAEPKIVPIAKHDSPGAQSSGPSHCICVPEHAAVRDWHCDEGPTQHSWASEVHVVAPQVTP
jgi:hypothetical protein